MSAYFYESCAFFHEPVRSLRTAQFICQSLKVLDSKEEIFSFSCLLTAGWFLALRPSFLALPVLAWDRQSVIGQYWHPLLKCVIYYE